MKLTVACVLKRGKRYSSTHVRALQNGVARNLSLKHNFVCLSDVNVPCQRIKLQHNWKGWWSKVELFKLSGPVLYLDLDVLPVGSLDDIAAKAFEKRLTILRDFNGPGFNSSVMAWNVNIKVLYDTFKFNPEKWITDLGHRGDQGFIEDNSKGIKISIFQDTIPDQVVSYKKHNCVAGIPEGARLVCLHGRPKFGDMKSHDRVRAEWELNGQAS